jgi:hypothetical protein
MLRIEPSTPCVRIGGKKFVKILNAHIIFFYNNDIFLYREGKASNLVKIGTDLFFYDKGAEVKGLIYNCFWLTFLLHNETRSANN